MSYSTPPQAETTLAEPRFNRGDQKHRLVALDVSLESYRHGRRSMRPRRSSFATMALADASRTRISAATSDK